MADTNQKVAVSNDVQLEDGPKTREKTSDDATVEQLFSSGDSITPEALYAVADAHGVHEHRSGRLVLDPEEAEREFGATIASRLKTKDGFVLWPQPDDSPLDPQNWSDGKKTLMLTIVRAL
jgi:hypothetical protein